MKAEERQHLHTNELGELTQKLTPVAEKYGVMAVVALFAAIAVGLGLNWARSATQAQQAVAWTELAAAQSPRDLAAVADKFPNSLAGASARLRESENYLSTGIQLLFTERELALKDIERARDGYEKLLKMQIAAAPMLREGALFGLARAEECLVTTDTKSAVEAYRRLSKEFPESIFLPYVTSRLEALESKTGEDFYAWFSQENPRAAEPPRPKDGLLNDPLGGDLFPGSDDAVPPSPKGDTSATEPATPATTTPELPAAPAATSEAAPAEAAPAAPPATESPATPTPPAEAPATDTEKK